MSDAQILFLEGLINKKLYEQTNSLRKRIAHQGLYMRLLPFVTESNKTLHQNEGALNPVIEEAQDRAVLGQTTWMRSFEDNIAYRTLIERFAALTLDESEECQIAVHDWRG
ncbi:hypothetical protein B0J11DRAFT_512243 [Dendryphion nanum]|uniref:Uncharacterized protein n=1 Tax=Dendryphion nanum TaxID=256645 RepID=A0A9P9D230_9PLEO|nr:hypothetical protein B0J11DRAFT_512243 [Dendryphion nanum]